MSSVTVHGGEPVVRVEQQRRSAVDPRTTAVLLARIAELRFELAATQARATRAEERAAKAERRATVDVLTGLLNLRGWRQAASVIEARCRRRAIPAGVIMLDLDDLKRVNDTSGHEAGDQLLSRVGAILRRASRDEDIAARLGGDEFGVLVIDTGNAALAAQAHRLHQRFATAGISVSLGWAARDEGGLVAAMQTADRALYAAKAARRKDRPRSVRLPDAGAVPGPRHHASPPMSGQNRGGSR
jgi:diguanylate cyclase (GGDEF)-like protein